MKALHVFPVSKFAQAIAKCMPSCVICLVSKEEIVASFDIFGNVQFNVSDEVKVKLLSEMFNDGAYAIFTRKRSNVIATLVSESQYHVGEYKLVEVANLLSSLPKGRMLAIKRMGRAIDVNVRLTAEIAESVLSA